MTASIVHNLVSVQKRVDDPIHCPIIFGIYLFKIIIDCPYSDTMEHTVWQFSYVCDGFQPANLTVSTYGLMHGKTQ